MKKSFWVGPFFYGHKEKQKIFYFWPKTTSQKEQRKLYFLINDKKY